MMITPNMPAPPQEAVVSSLFALIKLASDPEAMQRLIRDYCSAAESYRDELYAVQVERKTLEERREFLERHLADLQRDHDRRLHQERADHQADMARERRALAEDRKKFDAERLLLDADKRAVAEAQAKLDAKLRVLSEK